MNLEEVNELIKELLESNPKGDKWYLENRLDQLLWKLEKTLYYKNKIDLAYGNLNQNLQSIKQKCIEKYNEDYNRLKPFFVKENQKWSFKYNFEIPQDKDLFFEMESFVISSKSSLDLLVKIMNIYYPNSATRNIAKFKTSLDNKYKDDELRRQIDLEWSKWMSDLMDYRDFIVHESLLYSRLTVSIDNGYVSIIPPAVPNTAIKSHDYYGVEDFKDEFKRAVRADSKEEYDKFWDVFYEYYTELKAYAENIWNRLYSFIVWALAFLSKPTIIE